MFVVNFSHGCYLILNVLTVWVDILFELGQINKKSMHNAGQDLRTTVNVYNKSIEHVEVFGDNITIKYKSDFVFN